MISSIFSVQYQLILVRGHWIMIILVYTAEDSSVPIDEKVLFNKKPSYAVVSDSNCTDEKNVIQIYCGFCV